MVPTQRFLFLLTSLSAGKLLPCPVLQATQNQIRHEDLDTTCPSLQWHPDHSECWGVTCKKQQPWMACQNAGGCGLICWWLMAGGCWWQPFLDRSIKSSRLETLGQAGSWTEYLKCRPWCHCKESWVNDFQSVLISCTLMSYLMTFMSLSDLS